MRLIDADELIKRIYPMGMGDGMYVINAKAVKFAIDKTPTADVVPKSEVAIEVIEHLENNGLLNMTPQGIANLKKKYTENAP